MFFDDYKSHKDAQVRGTLLWEYDLNRFNWDDMRTLVVQRVIERGRMDDFYAVLNLYGVEQFKQTVRELPVMNRKDIAFVCTVFGLPEKELKCYTQKQFRLQLWNS